MKLIEFNVFSRYIYLLTATNLTNVLKWGRFPDRWDKQS